jgi:hypothetical protein
MPRGTCDNCGQHDVFVHATPLALGRNVFLCARCLNPWPEWDDREDDERAVAKSPSVRTRSSASTRI